MNTFMMEEPLVDSLFAPHREITDPNECVFYHTMELPGEGVIPGAWDLRGIVDEYLGHVPLKNKRVLELGTASGFLCFEMEKRGANVVGYDLNEEQDWDIVPFDRQNHEAHAAERKRHIRQLNNGWWYSHRKMQSKAQVVYGNIYEIPEEIGPVDIATFGCILLHLRDPFLALSKAANLVKDKIIVTEHDCHWHPRSLQLETFRPSPRRVRGKILKWMHKLLGDGQWVEREDRYRDLYDLVNRLPLSLFLPNTAAGGPNDTWWYLRPSTICEMLGVLGFSKTRMHRFQTIFNGKPQDMFTIVAERDPRNSVAIPWRLEKMMKEAEAAKE